MMVFTWQNCEDNEDWYQGMKTTFETNLANIYNLIGKRNGKVDNLRNLIWIGMLIDPGLPFHAPNLFRIFANNFSETKLNLSFPQQLPDRGTGPVHGPKHGRARDEGWGRGYDAGHGTNGRTNATRSCQNK